MKKRNSSRYDVYDASWYQAVLVFIICLFLKLWMLTVRFKITKNLPLFQNLRDQRIVIIWHNRIFCTPMLMRRYHTKVPMSGLVSPSKDGALLAEIFKNFGVKSIRGSSNRRGLASMMELVRVLDSSSVCITPDGPKGPIYKIKKGALKVAELSGKPMMIIRAKYKRFVSINKTWDKLMLPLPFSTIELEAVMLTYSQLESEAQNQGISTESYLENLLGK